MNLKNTSAGQLFFRMFWRVLQNDKRSLLGRLSTSQTVWIESGTYVGHTTKLLANKSQFVFSIEPILRFVTRARVRLLGNNNVTVLNGTSESVLEQLLSNLSLIQGSYAKRFSSDWELKFFLDGHNSGIGTYRGDLITPIEIELRVISSFIDKLPISTICVDDWRLFSSEEHSNTQDPNYPSCHSIQKILEGTNFEHTVTSDVLIATRK